jgi:hypothetical protein
MRLRGDRPDAAYVESSAHGTEEGAMNYESMSFERRATIEKGNCEGSQG